MKSILLTIVVSATLSLISAIPHDLSSNVSLSSNLPDPRFKIRSEYDATLLPVNAAFLNILFFMGTVAIQPFTEQLAPRRYSAPGYRQVEIQSYAWTESRFLLWGMYLAITDMVKHVRFHNTMIELYWEDKLVGRMKIAAKYVLSVAGNDRDDIMKSLDNGALNQTISNQSSTPISTHGNLVLPAQTLQKGKTTEGNSTADALATLWNATDPSSSVLPTLFTDDPSLTAMPSRVEFTPVRGASIIDRNTVFLTFFAGMLHVAQFGPDDDMSSFQIASPIDNVSLKMYKSSFLYQYGRAIHVMTYVPRYMAEHPTFGYRETLFKAKSGNLETCRGSLLRSLLS